MKKSTSKNPGEVLPGRVEEFIRRHGLYRSGARVLVACSGGPDSVALLEVMRTISPEMGISVGVVSVDHRQYPGSDRVLAGVRSRCRRWHLPFHGCALTRTIPPGTASEDRLRNERYRLLKEVADRFRYSHVATGHTRSDQAETVLMRILRGTGVAGLGGIPPMRSGIFIRPLLYSSREEVLAHLKSRRLCWFDDPTNADRRILRNLIREEILPMLKRKVNPALEQALLRLSWSAVRDNDFILQAADELSFDRGSAGGEASLPLPTLARLHDAVAVRVLLSMLQSIRPLGANLEQHHLERILSMRAVPKRQPEWSLSLPGGLTAGVEGKRFFLRQGPAEKPGRFSTLVAGPGEYPLEGGSWIGFRVVSRRTNRCASIRTACFDADALQFPFQLRSVTAGDRMRPFGLQGSRKVSRILMEAGVPRRLRPQVPLLVKDQTVLWIAGLRRSDAAPVRKNTRRILVVELRQKP